MTIGWSLPHKSEGIQLLGPPSVGLQIRYQHQHLANDFGWLEGLLWVSSERVIWTQSGIDININILLQHQHVANESDLTAMFGDLTTMFGDLTAMVIIANDE